MWHGLESNAFAPVLSLSYEGQSFEIIADCPLASILSYDYIAVYACLSAWHPGTGPLPRHAYVFVGTNSESLEEWDEASPISLPPSKWIQTHPCRTRRLQHTGLHLFRARKHILHHGPDVLEGLQPVWLLHRIQALLERKQVARRFGGCRRRQSSQQVPLCACACPYMHLR